MLHLISTADTTTDRQLERILHVEDDADIRCIVKLSLETFGSYTVETCASGQEAVEKVGPFTPDLILMDVMMPDMDGLSTVRKIRSSTSATTTPVILLTAKAVVTDKNEYSELGVVDVIGKPFDPLAISTNIRLVWNRYCNSQAGNNIAAA